MCKKATLCSCSCISRSPSRYVCDYGIFKTYLFMFMFSEYSMWLCERMKIYTNTCIFVCISSTENYWDDTVRTIRWLKCILTQTYTHTNGVYTVHTFTYDDEGDSFSSDHVYFVFCFIFTVWLFLSFSFGGGAAAAAAPLLLWVCCSAFFT